MKSPNPDRQVMLLGIGLDNDDGHFRATRGEIFHIVGGSHDTHQLMQEKCVKFDEKLRGRGKRLAELEREEFVDLALECEMDLVRPPRKRGPSGD